MKEAKIDNLLSQMRRENEHARLLLGQARTLQSERREINFDFQIVLTIVREDLKSRK